MPDHEVLTAEELDELERRQRAFRDYSRAEERFGTASAAQANEDAYADYRDAMDELGPKLLAAARRVKELEVELAEVRARADKAEANYRFMVERAADAKLDGYRELGERAANAEAERGGLRRALETAERERDELRDWVRRALPIFEAMQEAAAEVDPELWELLNAMAKNDAESGGRPKEERNDD